MHIEECGVYSKITLPGVIDLTNAPALKQALKKLYEKNFNTINVDCSQLKMIDCAGIGSLVLFQKRLRERAGELKLINVTNNNIRHLFAMIDLRRVISIE